MNSFARRRSERQLPSAELKDEAFVTGRKAVVWNEVARPR